jgi:hypothetical protein
VARPSFEPHWALLGLPADAYPPARYRLVPMEGDALRDCVEVKEAREYDDDGQFFARGLACPEIFGRFEPTARRPCERDRRFGRIPLRRPVAHPLRGPLDSLRELPVLPPGLRPAAPGEPTHPVTARYTRVVRANAALAQADHPNAFRDAYAELCHAVADLFVAPEGSLVALLGTTPALRWERLVRLDARAAEKLFDPVWADDEDTHLTLAVLAALGFMVSPR